LARAGHGSRRSAEALIAAGRVRVNGAVATLGTRADPDVDTIEVDGTPIVFRLTDTTILLYKPIDYVVTASDEQGRPTIYDLLPDAPPSLRYAGRLDIDTSGVLLLSTDGELVHRLTHPRYHVPKAYEAFVEGVVSERTLDALRSGVEIEDGRTAPAQVERIAGSNRDTLVRITIHEGRNRQVRRMFEAVGHRVMVLRRTSFGPVTLGDLVPGTSRPLTAEEVAELRRLVGLEEAGSA
ncbi:MAG: pseudouridine synthase, partial [Dehalococcoidia bacterium]|nr:pseudouridine synthase [Dehalococcoidia bacterium]